MNPLHVNEQEVISSLRALAECLGKHGATEWHEWIVDAYERASGNKSPAVDWSDLLWFARLNYLPVLRFVGVSGALKVSDAFESLLQSLLPDWPISVSGFTREGDRHDTTEVFGSLAGAATVANSSQIFCRSYCASLLSNAYDSAYTCLAHELRETVSQAAFVRAHERAYSRYGGVPLNSELYSLPAIYTGVVPGRQQKGPRWPNWVSPDARRSIAHVSVTADRKAETGFYIGLFLIESGAEYAVAKYEFFTL